MKQTTYSRLGRLSALGLVMACVLSAAPAVAALWTPDNTNSVDFWVDATDASTILTNGTAVTNWLDKSGNDNHLVQTDSGKQPATGQDTIGGLNVVTFEKVDSNNGDYMEATTVNHGTDFLLVGVWNTIQGVGVFSIDGDTELKWMSDVVQGPFDAGGEIGGPTTGIALYSLDIDRTGADQVEVFKNGISASSAGMTNDVGDAEFRLNCLPDLNYFGENNFAEVIISDDRSTGSRQMFEGYLAWKWGREGDLPVGHPYKDAAPTFAGAGTLFVFE